MGHWIEFPALGWHFSINDTLVSFGNFSIKYYGLLIALGFLLAVIYAYKRMPQFGLCAEGTAKDEVVNRVFDVVLVSTLLAFIGARLYYVLFSEDRAWYFESPVRILQIWNGGLGIYGGIILAFVTGLIMCRVRKVNTPAMFDMASLGFLIGQGIGRWGNFFNQEAFGANTTLPWGMTGDVIQSGKHINDTLGVAGFDPSLPVHPTFLYESLWCLLGFVLLHIMSKKFYKFKGQIFSSYIIWYGIGRFMIEGLRTDSLYLGSMKVSQLVAVVMVLVGVGLLFAFHAHANRLVLVPAEAPVTEETAENEEQPIEAEEKTDESNAD
ncbi:MAG: prolipoprotein diacylglyceryl transferase [Clostridia bacterium]|nr:prolipoprotein diacylglyceryl transferase [Clostridia bacterium]